MNTIASLCACRGRCSSCRPRTRVRRQVQSLSGQRYNLAAPELGESIGRFGPLWAHGGRTHGEPCVADFGMCDDYDVDAWHMAANKYLQFARDLRKTNIAPQYGKVATWPEKAKLGELAYQAAEKLVNGDLGYLDGSKVATLQEVQRLAKTALEFWLQVLEADLNTKIEVPEMQDHDRPKITPLPKLPGLWDFGKLALPIGLGLGLVLLLSAGGRR